MRLLFFTDAGFSYGVSRMLVEQVKAIHKQHNDVWVVVSSKELENNLIKLVNDDHIPILQLHGLENHQNLYIHIKQLSDYIITNKIDIVHVQSNWQLALITIVKYCLLFEHKIKIIYTIHSYRHNKPKEAIFAKIIIGILLFLFTDKIICTSNFLKRKFLFLDYKIVMLPLGVSDSFFEEYDECKTDCLRLVFPAQFRIGKNQDILIEAFCEYVKKTNDFTSLLYLPGEGIFLDKMKMFVQKLGIERQVIFPGQCTIEEVKRHYKESNIVVIASNAETFGLCIAEPFVIGRCIITRHVGIADDIITEGINGFFFDDKEELKRIISNVSKEKNKLRIIGKCNFQHRDIFNWHKIIVQYLQLIKSL